MDATRIPACTGVPGLEAFACVSRAWEAHEAELRAFLCRGQVAAAAGAAAAA